MILTGLQNIWGYRPLGFRVQDKLSPARNIDSDDEDYDFEPYAMSKPIAEYNPIELAHSCMQKLFQWVLCNFGPAYLSVDVDESIDNWWLVIQYPWHFCIHNLLVYDHVPNYAEPRNSYTDEALAQAKRVSDFWHSVSHNIIDISPAYLWCSSFKADQRTFGRPDQYIKDSVIYLAELFDVSGPAEGDEVPLRPDQT